MVSVGGFELQYILSRKHDLQCQTFSCNHDLQSQQAFRANMTFIPNKLFRANMIHRNSNRYIINEDPINIRRKIIRFFFRLLITPFQHIFGQGIVYTVLCIYHTFIARQFTNLASCMHLRLSFHHCSLL